MGLDLHIHSSFSDGTISPREIVRLAKGRGLKAISITDHDTTEGTDEALSAGGEYGVQVIPGIELSVELQTVSAHLLGYGFSARDSALQEKLLKLQEGRQERNSEILARLTKLGMELKQEELDEVAAPGLAGRPHIAGLMRDHGWVRSMDEAFERFLGLSKPAYAARMLLRAEEAMELLHAAGGIVVLAHPGQLKSRGIDMVKTIEVLTAMGLDGLEVYYPTHTKKIRKELLVLANRSQLVVSGGSDYHGEIRANTSLAGHQGVHVPMEILEKLNTRIDTRQAEKQKGQNAERGCS